MVFEVRVVGTVFHDRTRGRGFVASVHAVEEVKMGYLKCKVERSRAKGLGILNRHCTDDGKLMGDGVHLELEVGQRPSILRKLIMCVMIMCVRCMMNGSPSISVKHTCTGQASEADPAVKCYSGHNSGLRV